jgi:hypothetical protein
MELAHNKMKVGGYIWYGMKAYYQQLSLLTDMRVKNRADFKRCCIRSAHNYAVGMICYLASRYDCISLLEYSAQYERVRSVKSVNGRIDVAWFDGKGKLVAVFEVDRGFRSHSLRKVLSFQNVVRFLVHVGSSKRGKKYYAMKQKLSGDVIFVDAGTKSTKSRFR